MVTSFKIPNASDFVRKLTELPDLPTAVATRAARHPQKPFMILERQGHPTAVVTYADLNRRALQFAAAYRRRGLEDGATVILMLVAHPDLAAAFLGAMAAGLIPSLFPPMTPKLDPALFWASQSKAFDHIGVTLVITDALNAAELRVQMPAMADAVMTIEEVIETAANDVAPETRIATSGIAFLQHSSGTTGTKKGVVLTHRAVLDFSAALATALAVEQDDIIASWLPLYHDMGLIGCLVLPMVLGLTILQYDPFDWVGRPIILLEGIERHRATLCWQPNFAFHHLMRTVPKTRTFDLSSVRAFIDCSEPCKPATLSAFAERFGEQGLRPTALQVSYGMAENVFIATQTDMTRAPRAISADMQTFHMDHVIVDAQPEKAAIDLISVGPPIPGTEIRIVGTDGTDLPDRHVGEITLTSPYLFDGYFRRPSPETLKNGWYSTGDLGFISEGEIFVCGRKDDLLIINGRNIYAHDVEYAINRATEIKPGRCVVVGPFNPRVGSQALVVIAESLDLDAAPWHELGQRIRSLIQSEFGTVAHDVRIFEPGWMLKTTSGKISRDANIKKYLEQFPIG